MNVCQQCGTENEAGITFCLGCGMQINQGGGVPMQTNMQVSAPQQQYNSYNQSEQFAGGGTKKAKTAMITGIACLVLSCCCPLAGLGGIAAIITGLKSIKNNEDGRGMAIAGIVTGALAILSGGGNFILTLVLGIGGNPLGELMYDFM
jgi:hypothetical protein